jgi:hypothetical protein
VRVTQNLVRFTLYVYSQDQVPRNTDNKTAAVFDLGTSVFCTLYLAVGDPHFGQMIAVGIRFPPHAEQKLLANSELIMAFLRASLLYASGN